MSRLIAVLVSLTLLTASLALVRSGGDGGIVRSEPVTALPAA